MPVVPTPFPRDRAERISVNSFGIGGANAHAILESWNHATGGFITSEPTPNLLLLSANTEVSLAAQKSQFQEYLRLNPDKVQDVLYTCGLRRQRLSHRSFAIAMPDGDLVNVSGGAAIPLVRSPVTMIFSGQGAQWPEMGKELILTNTEFRRDLDKMDAALQRLPHPPKWNLVGKEYHVCLFLYWSSTDARQTNFLNLRQRAKYTKHLWPNLFPLLFRLHLSMRTFPLE